MKSREKENKAECTLYKCTVCRASVVYNLSLSAIPRAPQHFLNQLIFLNVVIEIPVAQTSVG